MKELMGWDECKKKHLKKAEPDIYKIDSIMKLCRVRLKVLKQIRLDDETASVLSEDYYEIIKELLTALMLKHGLKSDNHECLISFFKTTFPQYEYEANVIFQLKDVRNRINYDGIFVRPQYLKDNLLEFEHIIGLLSSIVTEKLIS